MRGRRRQSLSMLAAIKTRPTACGVGAHKQYVGPLINIVHSILTANTSHLSCTGNRHEATYDWTVKSIPGRKPVERSTARTTRETYAYPLHPKVVAFHLGDFVQDVRHTHPVSEGGSTQTCQSRSKGRDFDGKGAYAAGG